MPPILAEMVSSAFRCASCSAATIKSCSISTSSFDTTSGSIFSDCTCLAPLTTTVTMPPPALPSTRSSAICFCRRSCICCACFIICLIFIRARFVRCHGATVPRALGAKCHTPHSPSPTTRCTCDPHTRHFGTWHLAPGTSHLLHIANLRGEDLEHRLDGGIG